VGLFKVVYTKYKMLKNIIILLEAVIIISLIYLNSYSVYYPMISILYENSHEMQECEDNLREARNNYYHECTLRGRINLLETATKCIDESITCNHELAACERKLENQE